MAKILFLDRDGVVNQVMVKDGKPMPPQTLDEFSYVPGIFELCDRAKKDGFLIVIVTNQPDISRGLVEDTMVDQFHKKIMRELPIDEIIVCPHDDMHHCDCRKPKPGMLLRALQKYNARKEDCWMVGDRWRDVEAANAAGVPVIWIDYGYDERRPTTAEYIVSDLSSIVRLEIIQRN